MRARDRELLTRTVVDAAEGKIPVALQVTDNSAVRTLDNIEHAAEWGADVAVVEAPYFLFNAIPERLAEHYRTIADNSPLPLGLYDRGVHSPYSVPLSHLAGIVDHPRIVLVKDSSNHAGRRAVYLASRARRPDLLLLSGDEFDCVSCLRAGYDGLLLGGGIFNAAIARRIIAAVRAGNLEEANAHQARMTDLMHRVYGGPKIDCWLAGLKELMVQLGVFSSHANLLGYQLTDTCRDQIDAAVSGTDGLEFRADLLPDAAAETTARHG